MSPESTKVAVAVDGRELTLSNLHKVLYPEVGFTKGEVIDYYSRIAPVLLPHLADRPLTLKRYPDGVDGKSFFEKNSPSHRPDWVRVVELASPGSTKNRDTINYTVIDGLPSLVWAANLATLELHTPMWRVGPRGAVRNPDLLVFDLDPGAPATIVECCQVALLVRDRLAADRLAAYPKTSGSKGLQLYVPLDPKRPWEDVHAYSRTVADALAGAHNGLVVSNMKRDLRGGKVLVDWSQNNGAKTTVSVYSLRARAQPTVPTPVTWDEVEATAAEGAPLVFTAGDVLDRVDRHGDLFAPLLGPGQQLP
ncbi:MAG: bifunctional non-ous end joining protein LigD [Frankiales bacterium]|nr:bifunctional non-ous end joining protein LigD [Frankiales bacterium]